MKKAKKSTQVKNLFHTKKWHIITQKWDFLNFDFCVIMFLKINKIKIETNDSIKTQNFHFLGFLYFEDELKSVLKLLFILENQTEVDLFLSSSVFTFVTQKLPKLLIVL